MKWGCGSQTLQDMNSAWPTVGTEKIFFINQFIYSIVIVYNIYIYITIYYNNMHCSGILACLIIIKV